MLILAILSFLQAFCMRDYSPYSDADSADAFLTVFLRQQLLLPHRENREKARAPINTIQLLFTS